MFLGSQVDINLLTHRHDSIRLAHIKRLHYSVVSLFFSICCRNSAIMIVHPQSQEYQKLAFSMTAVLLCYFKQDSDCLFPITIFGN